MAEEEINIIPKDTQKIGEARLDQIINNFYINYSTEDNTKKYIFDFSNIEWIANQELLVLTGLFKYLIDGDIEFKVNFLKRGSSADVDERKAKKFIQIWDIWKIYKIVPNQEYDRYFDIDGNFIERLRNRFKIKSKSQEIYERYGVAPFVWLIKIENYDDKRISELLDEVYKLNEATNEILLSNNCHIPFENRTLSYIITKELYENFLDHFKSSLFETQNHHAFMSILLKRKFREELHDERKIQSYLKRNFQQETFNVFKGFAYDNSNRRYKNQSLLEFSFLDFGIGISSTLKEAYNKADINNFSTEHKQRHENTRVLEYAFRFDSSQHQISDRYKKNILIPRGLFDLLSIVKRFEGLLVARSNYGKVAYDFSDNKSVHEAIIYFGNENLYFPGTLISIYIPERNLEKGFDSSVIKPYGGLKEYSFAQTESKYVSVFSLQQALKQQGVAKGDLYDSLFDLLVKEFTGNKKKNLIYLDFEGFDIDERVSRKIIYFLATDYRINVQNNVIVLNPPPKSYLDNIQKELFQLSGVVKQYVIHPTPFIFLKEQENELELDIYWMGVFDENDIDKLNNLLFVTHDLRKSDFEQPDNVVGHVNYYDTHGNLHSIINDKKNEIIKLYKERATESKELEIKNLVLKCLKKIPDTIYLCNGHYYQNQYLQLFDALSNSNECDFLSAELFKKLTKSVDDLSNYKFLTITSSSQKISDSIIAHKWIAKENCIALDSIYSFRNEDKFRHKIRKGDKFILFCDVISTGYMTKIVENALNERNATLDHIAVLVDAMDDDFEPNENDYNALRNRLTAIFTYPINKFRRDAIKNDLIHKKLKVTRVNPFTNTPITMGLDKSNYEKSVLLTNHEFMDLIEEEHIKAGYFEFNNLIHPYFFDMDSILKDDDISKRLLMKIFDRIDSEYKTDLEIIFYPRRSGIRNLNFDILKDEILKNQRINIYELERFSTYEGWRFPHPAEFLYEVARGKKVLILDDGSCSGESIIQMIDEVAFLGVNNITVLSIIGRINDHKREFFSRIKSISKNGDVIKFKVFFGSHWHIPTYYIEESPVTIERRWLKNIIKIENVPQKIKYIAKEVLKELSPKDIHETSNKHLLKNKDGSEVIKELILTKEEIGKVTTYRFYTEYFESFDEFIAYYESGINKNNPERYKKIELLSAVFLHEPYLFERFGNIMPDVADKIREFIITILIGNPKKKKQPQLDKEKLFYKWWNKDLFHLLFTVNNDNDLKDLLNPTGFHKIINQFGKNPADLSYLFYKLLRFFPLHRDEIDNKNYAGEIMHMLHALSEKLNEKGQKNHLKVLISFLSTLPYSQTDFTSHLTVIKNNYGKLVDSKYHDESIHNDKQVLVTQLQVLSKKRQNDEDTNKEVATIQQAWSNISEFIEEFLSFSRGYPSFFLNERDYQKLEYGEGSLSKISGILQYEFYLGQFDNIQKLLNMVNELFKSFIEEDSRYSTIFNCITTPNINDEFVEFIDSIKSNYEDIQIEYNTPQECSIALPKVFLQEIVFKEIKQNLRYADKSKKIRFLWSNNGDHLNLKIENKIDKSIFESGSGKGIERLERLNEYPVDMAYYNTPKEDIMHQELLFKKI